MLDFARIAPLFKDNQAKRIWKARNTDICQSKIPIQATPNSNHIKLRSLEYDNYYDCAWFIT